MRLVIIESPYAGNVELNTAYARACLRDSLARGEAPIASHLLYTQVLDDTKPEERAQAIAAGLAWRKAYTYEKTDMMKSMQFVPEVASCVHIEQRPVLPAFYLDLGISSGMRAARDLYLRERTPFQVRLLFAPLHWGDLPRLLETSSLPRVLQRSEKDVEVFW